MTERSAVFDAEAGPDSPNLDVRRSHPPIDRVFDVLAARRQVVDCLARRGETVAFESLVTSVAATRMDIEPVALSEADRESTRHALHHSHLPKLVDKGIVEFDRETETVAPGPRLGIVAASLEAVEELTPQ
ncbi:hypothetical protein HAPAU_25460 [Halalkalicoccus paucihalophilus]|uniref:DUF7344 domain-containing protein n=1 Tax=Halalkalicoccus paucihalophilus TaxID=1008153 RepID=A0A151ADX1_9EURY|nr:hypothetical protein [Halalkalicoccus paucihalophilus]KYH25868.1 hypothetical protein HAPAU_25460 [Halalkalicoccus paucihalophilus]